MTKNEILGGIVGIGFGAALTVGAFALDQDLTNGVNARVESCIEQFTGSNQSECIHEVNNNAASYQLTQVGEVIGLAALAGSVGYVGVKAFRDLFPDSSTVSLAKH